VTPASIRKWVAFGGGLGIQISGPRGAESLHVAAVRVRPSGARVLGQFTIEDFPHQAAGVWGTDYAAFARKLGLGHVGATVLLPRQDVIVRTLALPGVADSDLTAAVQFQLEGLHPYSEDDVVTSWAKLEGSAGVLVAIGRREVVDRYALAFAEAGVKVASFTCSAAAIHSALRLFGTAAASNVLAWEHIGEPASGGEQAGGQTEIYGESAARPVFSATFDTDPERAAALAVSELRVTAPTVMRFEDLLGAAPALPYAASLVSACPRAALPPGWHTPPVPLSGDGFAVIRALRGAYGRWRVRTRLPVPDQAHRARPAPHPGDGRPPQRRRPRPHGRPQRLHLLPEREGRRRFR
jgi:hypothetical protein